MINIQLDGSQVDDFRAGWLGLFRKHPESKNFRWNFRAFQCMTQEEREIVAVCIKNNKTNGQIANALEAFWL